MKSIENLERSLSLNNPKLPDYVYEVLTRPDFGGRQVIIPGLTDRNLPTPESSDHTRELRQINEAENFLRRGGVEVNSKEIQNFSLTLAIRDAKEAIAEGREEEFSEYEIVQIEKALRERYNSAESSLIYTIDEEYRLRNDIYPTEPFAQGIERGIWYLKYQGSPDSEREAKELEGFLKVENVMVDPETPINTKMMVISPPSQLKDSIYVKNFVDIYDLQEVSGKRVVSMTRFASNATYGEATDSYLLSHPTRIEADSRKPNEIFAEKFTPDKKSITEETMEEILKESRGRIRFFVNALINPRSTAEELALGINAILNGADRMKKKIIQMKDKVVGAVSDFINGTPIFRNMKEEVDWLGRMVVEKIKAACGVSKGLSIKQNIRRLVYRGMSKMRVESKMNIGNCSKCFKANVPLECGVCDSCAE